MHAAMSMLIHANEDAVFQAASRVEEWATFLAEDAPAVTVVRGHAVGRVFRLRPRCRRLPIALTIVQQCDPVRREIHFRHVFGLTKGLTSIWRVTSENGATRLSIDDTLAFEHPLASTRLGRIMLHRLVVSPLRRCILNGVCTWLENRATSVAELQRVQAGSRS